MATNKQTTTTKTSAKNAAATQPQQQKGGALVKQQGGAVAELPDADLMADMAADAGKGLKNVDADSVAIPFLAVLQSNSPQVDPDDGAYIPDAKPGMLFNTVTKELFDGKEGVLIIPCEYQRKFLRWAPREMGGGFKGEVPIDAVVRMRQEGALVEMENRLFVPDDNGNVNPKKNDRVADTRVHYVIFLNPETGAAQQAVISLGSTQIKKSKQLIALLGNVQIDTPQGKRNPPTFANMVRVVTVPESNEKGKWSGVTFALEGLVRDPALYAMAKQFHTLVSAGRADVNYEAAAAAGVGGEGGPTGSDGF